ncbi:hypothetical protein CCHR01_14286 [Colletotrichum chrysophilum]|uniref:Uncharacterized protein n=1 Tax=Colletotrichum chrysophilum TaxID=1836956 RepID=A0AAD9ECE3_9PEZI|nr:hypothetical protein CCHR01_14286 [Colletotrichum chrysophilum]
MTLAPTSTVALASTTEVGKDALTTPFRYPWDCATIREAASWIHVDGKTKGTTDIAFSNLANPRISACQPSQWKKNDGRRQLNFSPAVCPSDWVAHLLATKTISSTTLSTAYCCVSNYRPVTTISDILPIETMYPVCLGYFDSSYDTYGNRTATYSNGSTTVYTEGYDLHPAWHITWQESDTSTLSPPPPSLSTTLDTCVPGEAIATTSTAYRPDGSRGLTEFLVLITVIPSVIGIMLCGCCVWCCVSSRRDKRKKTGVYAEPLPTVRRTQAEVEEK